MTPDPAALRRAFGRFLTGVTVVTTRDARGQPQGFTANSFTSVSLDPPLLLVCPGNHLSSFETFRNCAGFGVSVLSEGQEDISNLFASRTADRFGSCTWTDAACGIPLISGRAAGFVCEATKAIPAGDHVILLGQVMHFDDGAKPGLGYGPDGYFSRTTERQAEAPAPADTRASVLLERDGCLYLSEAGGLPTVAPKPGKSPLQALQSALRDWGVEGQISGVYAVYDEDHGARRIVFRGRLTGDAGALSPYPIAAFESHDGPDLALSSMLRRFAAEHRRRSFGFYYGTAHAGDVLPASEGA